MGEQRLSEEQIAELKQVTHSSSSPSVIQILYPWLDSLFCPGFNEFDVDGGGNISTKELGWAMRAMGMNPTENALLELINEVQTDQNHTEHCTENHTEYCTENHTENQTFY